MNTEIFDLFTASGGELLSPPDFVLQRAHQVKALLFDWDGVFNNGVKTGSTGSPFSEADSMGTNLARFSIWLSSGQLPPTAIITGEQNPAAVALASREGFQAVYFKIKHKANALAHFCNWQQLQAANCAFFFDDVLDLSLAQLVGFRVLCRRNASPMFNHWVKTNQLAEYITGSQGGEHAVREGCELLIGLNGQYARVMEHRVSFSDAYQTYLKQRAATQTMFFTEKEGQIVLAEPPAC